MRCEAGWAAVLSIPVRLYFNVRFGHSSLDGWVFLQWSLQVCADCCLQLISGRGWGSRSCVFGLLGRLAGRGHDGSRTRLGLINGQVDDNHVGSQSLGAYLM